MVKFTSPILIVSPPRSGSSLMGMILAESGVFCGKTKPGDKYNKYGYFENIAITKLVVDHLKQIDGGLGKKFQPVNQNIDIPNFGNNVLQAVADEGYKLRQQWFYKDPKIALTWKLWHKHFPDARWLILKRETKDTFESIARTDFMDAYQTRQEWLEYLNKFKENINAIKNTVPSWHEFNIESIFQNNEPGINKMYSFLEVENKNAHIKCFDKNQINAGK